MKYAIIVYESDHFMSARTDPARQADYWAAYTVYSKALRDAGVAAGGTALEPPSLATTLRISAGDRHVQDGPYADTKDQLGGMFVINVPTLDDALKWAALCPSARNGAVEIRPVLEM